VYGLWLRVYGGRRGEEGQEREAQYLFRVQGSNFGGSGLGFGVWGLIVTHLCCIFLLPEGNTLSVCGVECAPWLLRRADAMQDSQGQILALAFR